MVKRRNGNGRGGNAHQRAMAAVFLEAVEIVPVPIQDSPHTATEKSGTELIEIDPENKPVVELSIEVLFGVLLFLYPYGAEQMNLPHNFWLGLGSWVVGMAIAVRMFWILLGWKTRFSPLSKSLIAFIVVVLFAAGMYSPVVKAYRSGQDKGKSDQRAISTPIAPAAMQYNQNPAADPCSLGHVNIDGFRTNGTTNAVTTNGKVPCLAIKNLDVTGGQNGIVLNGKLPKSIPAAKNKNPASANSKAQ